MRTAVIRWMSGLIEPRQQLPVERQKFSNSKLLQMILPIVAEQFLALIVGIVDTMMVSYAGEAAVSGVALVNQLNNVFILTFTALASGGSIIASQYAGSQDEENGTLAAGQLLTSMVLLSAIITALVLIFGQNIFTALFGNVEQDVSSAGMIYLRISAYSFAALAIYDVCSGLYRSMGRTKELMYVSIGMNVINVIGNAIGIFVLHAGVAGVAYSSLTARSFAAVVMLVMCTNKKLTVHLELDKILSWNQDMIRRILHVGIPGGIDNCLYQFAKIMLSIIVARFGTIQIAANSVSGSYLSMTAVFCTAMGQAFMTVTGQYVGAKDTEGAEYYMMKMLRFSYLGALIWNAAFLALSPLVLGLYKLSDETMYLAMVIVVMQIVINILFGPLSVSLAGGLRAAGDIRFSLYSSFFASVICRVALAVLFGLIFNMGVIGIGLAIAGDTVIKGMLVLWRWRSGRWKNMRLID